MSIHLGAPFSRITIKDIKVLYLEKKSQLDATDCSLFQNLLFDQHVSGHHYAHHQELNSIIQVVAACGTWCFGFQVVGMVWS